MSRYIDADALPELFNTQYKATRKLIDEGETHLDNLAEGFTEATRVIRFIATTANVAPVVHGNWIKLGNVWECSNCHETISMRRYMEDRMFFCNFCGAKMDEIVAENATATEEREADAE